MNLYPLGRVDYSSDRLVYWYFATPLLQWQIAECDSSFNEKLLAAIRKRRANEPTSREVSNRLGWQSTRDLFTWPEHECIRIRELAVEAMGRIAGHLTASGVLAVNADVDTESWANVSSRGGYHVVHSHSGYSWSGVYYVDDGGARETDGGRIELIDPRTNVSIPGVESQNEARLSLTPKSGLMIMFPSWLQHYVTPHEGDRDRVSIAFNLRIRPR
jgi:uncharacterized protein (TIGR02466 family)